jgi:hypothetical protein
LLQSLKDHYKIRNLEARLVPRFPTKGNVDHAVALLHNWLVLNALSSEYEGVMIIAHSMGGLIAADAIIKLLKLNNTTAPKAEQRDSHPQAVTKETNETPPKSGWVDWMSPQNVETLETIDVAKVTDTSWSAQSNEPCMQEAPITPTSHLNLIGLLCYDSPFFGLNPSLFAMAAGKRASDIVETYLSPESLPRQLMSQVSRGIQAIPASLSTGATKVKELSVTAYSAMPSSSTDQSSTTSIVSSTTGVLAQAPASIYSNVTSAYTTMSTRFGFSASKDRDVVVESLESLSIYEESINETVESLDLDVHSVTASQNLLAKGDKENGGVEGDTEELHAVNQSSVVKVRQQSLFEDSSHDDNYAFTSNAEPPQLLPTSDVSYSSMVPFGLLSTMAVAGGAYYAGGLAALGSLTFARNLAVAYALSHAGILL